MKKLFIGFTIAPLLLSLCSYPFSKELAILSWQVFLTVLCVNSLYFILSYLLKDSPEKIKRQKEFKRINDSVIKRKQEEEKEQIEQDKKLHISNNLEILENFHNKMIKLESCNYRKTRVSPTFQATYKSIVVIDDQYNLNNKRFLESYIKETIPQIIRIIDTLHLQGEKNQKAILDNVNLIVEELYRQFNKVLEKNKEYHENDTTKVLEVEKLYLQVKGKQL